MNGTATRAVFALDTDNTIRYVEYGGQYQQRTRLEAATQLQNLN